MILSGFSIPHSLSFLEGFSYTKNNRYLGVIMDVSDVFRPRTQLNDALIESYRGADCLLSAYIYLAGQNENSMRRLSKRASKPPRRRRSLFFYMNPPNAQADKSSRNIAKDRQAKEKSEKGR